jgi:hypothetical protein
MAIVNNAVEAMESLMEKDQVRRAHAQAEGEILAIRLSALGEGQGMRQAEVGTFSQSSASRLERRKDMRISTLIEYLDGIGMGLEIRALPKDMGNAAQPVTLLKV